MVGVDMEDYEAVEATGLETSDSWLHKEGEDAEYVVQAVSES